MAAAAKLTWFGGYEGVVARRGHTLDLHLLTDDGHPFCGTGRLDLRPVTKREASGANCHWCLTCLDTAQKARRDGLPEGESVSPDPVAQLRKRERDYRSALDRRRTMLERRLDDWDPRRDADRTREELAALRWAIQLIDACEQHEVFALLRERGQDV